MKPTLTITGPRPVLRMERQFAHPAEKVWRALTDPEQPKHWFPGAFSGDLGDGVVVCFARPLTAPVAGVEPVPDAIGVPGDGADLAAFRLEGGAGPNSRAVVEQRLPAHTDAAPVRIAWKAYLQAIADRLPGGSASI